MLHLDRIGLFPLLPVFALNEGEAKRPTCFSILSRWMRAKRQPAAFFFLLVFRPKKKAKRKKKLDGNELFLTYIHLKKRIRATSPRSFKSVLMTIRHLSNSARTEIYPLSKQGKKAKHLLFLRFLVCRISPENLILIHVILRDGAGPAHSHSEMHQCPEMPARSQSTDSKSLGVISHSVIILFRNIMGFFQRKFRLTSEKREVEG